MEGHSPFLSRDGGSPPYEPASKQRGCVFYGCVIAAVLAVLLALLVGLLVYSAYRLATKFVAEYAEDAATPIAVSALPPEQIDEIKARVSGFQEALEKADPAEPLVLTAAQINALLDTIPIYKGVIAVEIDGDTIRGKVSFPCERLFGLFKGKYLNGNATFKIGVDDGMLFLRFATAEVKGRPIADADMARLREENLVKDANTNPKYVAQIRQIDRIEVKDGKLTVFPKPRPAPKADEKKVDEKKGDESPPAEAAKKPEPPPDKAEPK